jgi:predicted dehydrogenase
VTPLRVGVVGYGGWARAYLGPGLLAGGTGEIAAICGADADRVAAAAAETGAAGYTSLRAMLDEQSLEAVLLAGRPASRIAAGELAAARGLALFAEKPVGLTGAQTARLVAATRDVPTMVGFTLRWSPTLRALRDLVRSGEIGDVTRCRIRYLQSTWADPGAPWSWHGDADQEPFGVLSDVGPHPIDLVRWILGDIDAVSATGGTTIPSRAYGERVAQMAVETLDDCDLQLRLSSGASATIACSRVSPEPDGSMAAVLDLLGTAGWARFDLADGDAIRVGRRGAPPARIAVGRATEDPLLRLASEEMADFAAVARRASLGRDDLPTLADGHAAQLVIDAAGASVADPGWVSVAA